MGRNINAVLGHGTNSPRIQAMGFNSRTKNLGFISRKMPQVAFGNLASAAVART
jgi:hypothetical protein